MVDHARAALSRCIASGFNQLQPPGANGKERQPLAAEVQPLGDLQTEHISVERDRALQVGNDYPGVMQANDAHGRYATQPYARSTRQRGMELHHRIYRSRTERMLAGVAGGMAEYADIDPTIARLIWLVAFVTTGPLALFLYVLCAIIIPREPGTTLV
jgi:phage shock protein C